MSTQVETQYTPEDLLAHPNEKDYELVDGELVELNVSEETAWIGGRIFRRIGAAGEDTGIGWVNGADCGFLCRSTGRDRVRKPDAAFILRSRLPNGPRKRGYGQVIPDFVAEVVSPNDLAFDVHDKVREWHDEGVSVVWVVWPSDRTVSVCRPNSDPQILREGDDLTLPELIPDFRCPVSDIFPPNGDG